MLFEISHYDQAESIQDTKRVPYRSSIVTLDAPHLVSAIALKNIISLLVLSVRI